MSTEINIDKSIKVVDETTPITDSASQLTFTGAGVTATGSGGNVTINIPGGSTGTVTNVTGVSPIASSGGNTPAISISDAAANGTTKGAATFTASDFSDNGSGVISLDYANGQKASGSQDGFLSQGDYLTFSGKQNQLNGTGFVKASGTTITYDNSTYLTSAITSLNGLTASTQTFATPGTTGTAPNWNSATSAHTLNIPSANASGVTAGLISNTEFTTFNNKVSTGAITGSGLTMATNRLLGRTTASSGAVEELSIGTGLTLSGGTLSSTGGGLTYFTEAESTTAPNATVPVDSLSAASSTTDADVAIIPKGNGALILDIPDNTATGGNKRGTRAIDLQLTRSVNTQVASGTDSMCIGQNNIASALYAIAIGRANNSGGNYAVCIGNSNIINSGSATIAVAIGTSNTVSNDGYALGQFNTINANDALGLGARTTNNSVIGRLCFASGRHSVNGDAQRSVFVLRAATTGNALTTVTTNGFVASTNNQVILNNQSAYGFSGYVVGKQQGNTNAAMWKIEGLIVRGANAASTVLTVSTVTLVSNAAGWGTPTLTADTTNGGLQVQVTGATATNIQWTVNIETTESIYA